MQSTAKMLQAQLSIISQYIKEMAYGLRNSRHIAFPRLGKETFLVYDESNHSTTVNRSQDSSDRRILFLFANAFCSFRTFVRMVSHEYSRLGYKALKARTSAFPGEEQYTSQIHNSYKVTYYYIDIKIHFKSLCDLAA